LSGVRNSCNDAEMRSGIRADTANEISPEGALAGRTVSLVLVGSAAALVVASWDELWRRCGAAASPCVERAAGAGLLMVLATFALACGIGIWLSVGRRAVEPGGSSRYVWALGVLFALGLALIATRIPAFACARGRFDDTLVLCMHPPMTSEPTSWLWVKRAIVVVGIAGGAAMTARPRAVRVSMPAAVAAWVAGAGWTIVDALVRHG
jgi:hypothetical protein